MTRNQAPQRLGGHVRSTGILTAVFLLGTVGPLVPAAGAQVPTFEVASVREHVSGGDRASRRSLPDGRLVITNMTLEAIVAFAYGLAGNDQQFRLIGGRSEILSKRFDIDATAPNSASAADHPLMLRALLAERFGLRTRPEVRQVPIYALTVARQGELGPALRKTSHDCMALAKSGALKDAPKDSEVYSLCVAAFGSSSGRGGTKGVVTRRNAGPMETLVSWAQGFLRDRRVVDLTGLAGNYQWEITHALDLVPLAPDSSAPSIFTAYEEQLGLTLEARTGSVETLVIESVAMPMPN